MNTTALTKTEFFLYRETSLTVDAFVREDASVRVVSLPNGKRYVASLSVTTSLYASEMDTHPHSTLTQTMTRGDLIMTWDTDNPKELGKILRNKGYIRKYT